ncbi:unnamed protein product [Cyprideis torosa]|uniref:Uncharacterized protein n=1 Tax=Cyprideis torosa TaxID=163714 RepID=A0A7R8WCE5_9CRUS|nr:unnamed protein product [Cyprideis torosa]CAG0891973.1 unnamed protein product [Cyprideis torosa]
MAALVESSFYRPDENRSGQDLYYRALDFDDAKRYNSYKKRASFIASHFMKEPQQFMKEPQQFMKEPQQFMKEPQQFMKEPQQFMKEPQQFMKEPQQFMKEPQQFMKEPQQFMKEPQQFMKEPQQFMKEPQQFGKEPQELDKLDRSIQNQAIKDFYRQFQLQENAQEFKEAYTRFVFNRQQSQKDTIKDVVEATLLTDLIQQVIELAQSSVNWGDWGMFSEGPVEIPLSSSQDKNKEKENNVITIDSEFSRAHPEKLPASENYNYYKSGSYPPRSYFFPFFPKNYGYSKKF